jgi:hypothetical protein
MSRSDSALEQQALPVRGAAAAGSRDVNVHFDHDVKLPAPMDAHALAKRLGLTRPGEATGSVPARKYLQAGR